MRGDVVLSLASIKRAYSLWSVLRVLSRSFTLSFSLKRKELILRYGADLLKLM